MMRYAVILLLVISLSGCSLPLRSDIVNMAPKPLVPTLGMTRAEVSALMSHPVTVGYEVDPATGALKPIEAKSLYSSEMLTVAHQDYLVDSYITGVQRAGKPIGEDVLTPMIFKDNILCGQGREALTTLKAGPSKAAAVSHEK